MGRLTRYTCMKTMRQPFTRIDWERLPEGFPAQLIQGQLVKEPSPTYRHQRLAARIRFALSSLLGPDRVPDTPADVAIDDENIFQPDVVVLSALADDASHTIGVPLLAVEVLSLSTRTRDRDVKAGRLLAIGVAEVWLVDPEARTIEVRTARARRVACMGDEIRSEAVPGFALIVEALFSPPRG